VRRRSAHEHTGTDGAIRHSLRNGFTAYAVLSPATNSSCHRRQRISGRSSSVELISPPHNLAPATGVGTTRFCRTQQHRSSCALSFTHEHRPVNIACAPDAAASTATCPNARDDGQRPSEWDRMATIVVLICPTAKAGNFSREGWTGNWGDLPVRHSSGTFPSPAPSVIAGRARSGGLISAPASPCRMSWHNGKHRLRGNPR